MALLGLMITGCQAIYSGVDEKSYVGQAYP